MPIALNRNIEIIMGQTVYLTDYCLSVTIVTNNQNDLFHSKIDQFRPILALFEVKMF